MLENIRKVNSDTIIKKHVKEIGWHCQPYHSTISRVIADFPYAHI